MEKSPKVSQSTDSKDDKVSVKIFTHTREKLEDLKIQARRERGEKLDFADLIEAALQVIEDDTATLASIQQTPAATDIAAGLSPKDRARVVALIEMLSGESTGVEHLDLMKAPVIGYLDTWASQTRKPSSGKKASGKHA